MHPHRAGHAGCLTREARGHLNDREQVEDLFVGFKQDKRQANGITINLRHGGSGPPLLLLHGFPQTHAIWHKVAPQLAENFTLVMPDLRGYGDSDKPDSSADHAPYSKRAMALDAVEVMRSFGFERFFVVGHDRGGRVAHRLALDHPQAVQRLMVLDISPTLAMYERTTMSFAAAYYHWFFLIQPEPLPERLIAADPLFYLHRKIGAWGSRANQCSTRARWRNTSDVSPAPQCTRCARTTAQRRRSIWTMIAST